MGWICTNSWRFGRPDRPVGGFGDPRAEVVRFGVPPSLAFPASEIQSLTLAQDGPARMAVNFLGLIGPSGVLPHQRTDLVGAASDLGDQRHDAADFIAARV